jgi:mannosyltransferase OCH1-like enzyme
MWGFKDDNPIPNILKDCNIIYPADIIPLVKKHPQLYEIWDKIPNWVTRCDIARYLFLYYNTGTYLDSDCSIMKAIPKDKLKSTNTILYTEHISIPTGEREDKSITLRIANFAMTSLKSKQKLWLECINESTKRIKDLLIELEYDRWLDTDIIWSAGPGMLSEVYNRLEDKKNITVLDNTYMNHQCDGSWRTKK